MPRDGRRLLSLNIANRVLDGLHRKAKSVYKRTCWMSRIIEVRKCQVGSQAGIEGRRKFSRDWQTVPLESDTSYSIPNICVGSVHMDRSLNGRSRGTNRVRLRQRED
ncbi:hypothetical protein KCU73_g90, partial [Aureobasidium melanogenum]